MQNGDRAEAEIQANLQADHVCLDIIWRAAADDSSTDKKGQIGSVVGRGRVEAGPMGSCYNGYGTIIACVDGDGSFLRFQSFRRGLDCKWLITTCMISSYTQKGG